jgi:hypothetical protein
MDSEFYDFLLRNNFQSNEISSKNTFGQLTIYRKIDLSVKRRSFKWQFGRMNLRSDGVSVKRRSVEKNRFNEPLVACNFTHKRHNNVV